MSPTCTCIITISFCWPLTVHLSMAKYHSAILLAGWDIDDLYKRENGKRVNKLFEDPVFDVISGTDIVMLIETHCSYSDNFTFPGYTVHNQIRAKSGRAKKHYGGISVLVKNDIRPGVSFLPSTNSEYLWLKLSCTFFHLPYDLYLLVVYVCPENSSFTGRAGDIFQSIDSDIATYSQLGKCVVFGDFNGRTATEPDYTQTMTKFQNVLLKMVRIALIVHCQGIILIYTQSIRMGETYLISVLGQVYEY